MKSDIDVNYEPLPGYRVIERLGAGGYGEVWRAEAPGGLTKAIKFVFGQQHEKRASNELRALERVRSVRHPFLLSLERIEVVEGRLVVVTELADESLKDRFEAYREEGLPGVPRDDLLKYLRDAADALDFMSDEHDLQHLDIKPENLLLLASHVKVADFGLVKDVRQSQASMVGGMTPLYAAPEVFRGMPSRHSDQYSLAILYQEMLTGRLPFAGGNAAELTLQHLNDEPDLSALSSADRYPVSRALSKDPEHRYASCREFVDALFNAVVGESGFVVQPVAIEPSAPLHFGSDSPHEGTQTELFDEDESDGWQAESEPLLIELPPSDGKLVDLPPLNLAGLDDRAVPTLFLGIGGAAGRVLVHLRQKLQAAYGEAAVIPAMPMLLIDTDSRALADATRRNGYGLTSEETLGLPLRRPQHYREQSQKLLQWLSRRWLYNIPRSLRTEGLRPLGRLALADAARQTGQRIRRALMQSFDAESINVATQATGQPFRGDAVQVFVVASISGGTGSGMSLDVGYAVRAILDKLELAHAKVIGVMMHGTGGEARSAELARVNAYSWLTEYQHYLRPECVYPGDPSCGFPPHEPGVAAFDHTYLIHLGENLDTGDFDQATASVAEYLCLNSLPPTRAFFDACRSSTPAPESVRSSDATLRSFGVSQHSATPNELCDEFAGIVSQQVFRSWQDPLAASRGYPPSGAGDKSFDVGGGEALARRLQLEPASIATNCRLLLTLRLGTEPKAFLPTWLAGQLNPGGAGEAAQVQAIDRIFAEPGTSVEAEREFRLLGEPILDLIGPLEDKLRSEVRRWVASRVDQPRERLPGARAASAWLGKHLDAVEGELKHLSRAVVSKVVDLRSRLTGGGHLMGASGAVAERVQQYFSLRFDQLALAAAEHIVRLLRADLTATADELTALGREVEQIQMAMLRAGGGETDLVSTLNPKLGAMLDLNIQEMAAAADRKLQTEYLDAHGGLLKTVMQGGRPRAQIGAKLYEFARQAVQHVLSGVNALDDMNRCGAADGNWRTNLSAATPSLLKFGGTRRVLVVLPNDAPSGTDWSQEFGVGVSVATGRDNNLAVCTEADALPIQHVAVELIQSRRDRAEFAERVHCRTDIDWTRLVSVTTDTAASSWGELNIDVAATDETYGRTVVL